MLSVSTIKTTIRVGFIMVLGCLHASSQENSPFSRYGIGDIFPGQHIISRGMGGVSSPYVDAQSINFYNPASYSGLKVVTFDAGLGIQNQTLRNADPVQKFTSVNFTPSYIALGVPFSKKKQIGLVFGLRPLAKINYSIQENKRLGTTDSLANLYEGNGGFNELFVGVGKRWKRLSIGINTGYRFGRREANTRVFIFNADTSSFIPFSNSNTGSLTTYGKAFIDAGLQYQIDLGNQNTLRLGLNADFKQSLIARRDLVRETFVYDNAGNPLRVDSVYDVKELKGTIELPATYTAGLLYVKTAKNNLGGISEKASIGIEYETSEWSKFRNYGLSDKLINNWQLRIGGQFTPNPFSITKYGNRISYRAGVNFGKDYINADGNELKTFGLTLGAGLPVRKWRSFDNQFTTLNAAFEYGRRGSNENNITENYFRVSFGVSLSDIWFVKRKYD